ncbi:MAG: four helix bundle protein [Bacteroidales bacterium]|nr:four helix bundle protein [Bacteroidales bacterium]MBD5282371.1 four helix bundle protein [Bacteroides sp.]MBD5352544.1 four helix bundle protein [Bacteroides sp.]MBD5372633.1 four helix bundle protein [Bacteroides sp.]
MSDNIVYSKSKAFALRIVNLGRFLHSEKHEYVISNQVVRSGGSIGANIAEAQFGATKAEFVHRMRIAVREANETKYWIELLHDSSYIDSKVAESLISDCQEIIYLLIRIIKTSDSNGS